ncbi:hypothetical protein OCS_02738 [Ophiocordyceps sinensis CO18]|uniref:Uncharacterized protein n=1 Tax=Ophiocordyceps sinensis (strain Co18 / CGMCC 3.14243) TaxID=911162 RepID=T5A7U0_OPHSC|nr:hypothetical protein OCS_02738 [Ophiocordyceps sinensis CO18]
MQEMMEDIRQSYAGPAGTGYDRIYQDRHVIQEASCFPYIFNCLTSKFFKRHWLSEIDEVQVKPLARIEKDVINRNENPIDVTILQSTAIASGTSQGWTYSGRLEAKIPMSKGEVLAAVGATYTDTVTATKTETTGANVGMKCASNKSCRLMTVSFQVTLTGQCEVEPMLLCGGDKPLDICYGFRGYCEQHYSYWRRNCVVEPDSSRAKYLHHTNRVPCNVTVPARHQDQSLRSFVLGTQRDVNTADPEVMGKKF